MQDSQPSIRELSPEQMEVCRMLYPLFKEEVFRRRESMIRLAASYSGVLVVLLVITLMVSPAVSIDSILKVAVLCGLAIFSSLQAYLIVQESHRHRQAKSQLIELETMMGLYQESWRGNEKTVYPQNWQTDWKADQSIYVYLTALILLSVLLTLVLLIRH